MLKPTDPEQLEKWRIATAKYRSRPEVKARIKARRETPEWRKKWNSYLRKRYQRPDVKKRTQEQQNQRYAESAEFRKHRSEYQRKYLRGVTPEMFERLWATQNGRCAICTTELLRGSRNVHTDHCHDTGKPRGLLCIHCNLIEGMLKNVKMTPLEFGQRLHEYLKKHE